MNQSIPHPFPYQGSKRKLADVILALMPNSIPRLVEPFAGSAALSLAAASRGIADEYLINDSYKPLAALWRDIINDPELLLEGYSSLWNDSAGIASETYRKVRSEFNASARSHLLLYLLARCVKASVRFNKDGHFNQSADLRRLGMTPDRMSRQLIAVSKLLRGKTAVYDHDYKVLLDHISATDYVYLDPPYQGTSGGSDTRYASGVVFSELIETLSQLNARSVPYILSYDGWSGATAYGQPLPKTLNLRRFRIITGRSSQSTLNGNRDITIESLYVSEPLVDFTSDFPDVIDTSKFPQRAGIVDGQLSFTNTLSLAGELL